MTNSHDDRHEPAGGPSRIVLSDDSEVTELTPEQCWALLGDTGIGHLALRSQPQGVDIVPINYLIHEQQLYFRSASGTKLVELTEHPHVAVQVERYRDAQWSSVVVKGRAERLAFDDEILASGVTRLLTSGPGEKANYVRIVPETITGRSFPSR